MPRGRMVEKAKGREDGALPANGGTEGEPSGGRRALRAAPRRTLDRLHNHAISVVGAPCQLTYWRSENVSGVTSCASGTLHSRVDLRWIVELLVHSQSATLSACGRRRGESEDNRPAQGGK